MEISISAPVLPNHGWRSRIQSLLERPLLAATVLNSGVLAFFFILFTPAYETNDDALMNMTAAGVGLDGPDEHLLYINVLVGLGLKALYTVAPRVPWYGSGLIALQFLASIAICTSFLQRNKAPAQLGLSAVFLAVVGAPCFVNLQFTRVAFQLGLAGILLWLNAADGTGPSRQIVWSIFFILLGSLIRLEACMIAFIPTLPVLALKAKEVFGIRRGWLLLLCLVLSIAGAMGLHRFNTWYYAQDERWRGFYEFNAVRAPFNASRYSTVAPTAQTKAALKRAGWKAVDYFMLVHWNFADRARFSTENLSAFMAALDPKDLAPEGRPVQVFGHLLVRESDQVLLMVNGIALFLLVARGRLSWAVIGLSLALSLGLLYYLYHGLHLPQRVSFPIWGGVVSLVIFGSVTTKRWAVVGGSTPVGFWRISLLGIVLGTTIWQLSECFLHSVRREVRHLQAKDMMQRLSPRANQLYVLWGHHFPYEHWVTPTHPVTISDEFKFVSLGTTTHTPWTASRLNQFGIGDLYRALCEREDVFLFSSPGSNLLLGIYLAEHYGIKLGTAIVFAHPALVWNEEAHLYRCVDMRTGREKKSPPDLPSPNERRSP